MNDKRKPQPETGDQDGPAAGTIDQPVAPDDAQPGDRSELGANLGGPVDVFPGEQRGAVDHNTPGGKRHPNRAGPKPD